MSTHFPLFPWNFQSWNGQVTQSPDTFPPAVMSAPKCGQKVSVTKTLPDFSPRKTAKFFPRKDTRFNFPLGIYKKSQKCVIEGIAVLFGH